MSRARTRPTREETKARLLEAAGDVFEHKGIGAASIENIVEAAGLTRGAFYSSFADKDELIIAMLEDHVIQSVERNLKLLAEHDSPGDFVEALRAVDRSTQDPLGRGPMLHIELVLYAARTAKQRPRLARWLDSRRELVSEIVARTNENARWPVDVELAGMVLLALEDGFRLHQLISPRTTPPDSFLTAVAELQRMFNR